MLTLLILALLALCGYKAGSWRNRKRQQDLAHSLAERNEELEAARQDLSRLSTLDELTQLATPQNFQEFLQKEWRRSLRDLTPISLILVTLDQSKTATEMGDKASSATHLKPIADILRRTARRPGDLVAHYHDQQFAVVLGHTDVDGATAIASKLQTAVAALNLSHPGSPADHLTISLGVATAVPNRGATWQEIDLIAAAERALEDAKRLGRNRVAYAEFQAT